MAEGSTVARAYVQVVPSAQGIKGAISNVLGGESKAAGISSGQTIGSNLISKVKGIIAAAGIGKFIGESVRKGAALEQSLGGVETLFKKSADKVKKNAQGAFKTVGVSANDYMEQVTSFSATLLQGLGGDTDKAAKYAHKAMVDMSDNANKFGTDISSIQWAYQGFAKQNYTMLDNLKLGYGGTQAEMARLINDTGVLGDKVKVTAKTVKDVPFDKIIEAIHKTQEELGVTGTTSKEASTTISGSFNSMKASWDNLLADMALGNDNLDKDFSDLTDTTTTFIHNLAPAITNVIESIPDIVHTIFDDLIPSVIDQLKKDMPNLGSFLDGFYSEFTDSFKDIFDGVHEVLKKVLDLMGGASPENYERLGAAIGKVAAGIATLKVAKDVTGGLKDLFSVLDLFKGKSKDSEGGGGGIFGSLIGGAGKASPILGKLGGKLLGTGKAAEAAGDAAAAAGETAAGAAGTAAETIASEAASSAAAAGTAAAEGGAAVAGETAASGAAAVAAASGPPGWIVALIAAAVAAAVLAIIHFWPQIKQFFVETVWPGIKSFFSHIGDFFTQTIPSVFGKVLDVIKTFFTETLPTFFTETIPNIIGKVADFFGELPGKIGYAIGFAVGTIAKWGINMVKKVIETVPKIISAIVDFFKKLPGRIWTFLTQTLPKIAQWGVQMAVKGATAVGKFIASVGQFLITLPGKVFTWLSRVLPKVASWGVNLVKKGAKAIADFGSAIWNGIKGLPEKFVSIGKDIVKGVWNGIKGMAKWVTGKIKDFFGGIVHGAKDALGIGSPSRVFASEVGKWIPAGIATGIEGNAAVIDSALNDAVDPSGYDVTANVRANAGGLGNATPGTNPVLALLNQYLPAMANMQIVMDSGATVGALAPQMTTAVNNRLSKGFR